MKKISKYISFFLLAALSLLITPKELLHEFTQHIDSLDLVCGTNCHHHLERAHQHCEALQLSSPTFYKSVHLFSFSFVELISIQSFESSSSYHSSSSPFLFFRGPPSISI